jgi:hypothetical protein
MVDGATPEVEARIERQNSPSLDAIVLGRVPLN